MNNYTKSKRKGRRRRIVRDDMPMRCPPILKTSDVARMFRKSYRRVQQLAQNGNLPATRPELASSPKGHGVEYQFLKEDVANYFGVPPDNMPMIYTQSLPPERPGRAIRQRRVR